MVGVRSPVVLGVAAHLVVLEDVDVRNVGDALRPQHLDHRARKAALSTVPSAPSRPGRSTSCTAVARARSLVRERTIGWSGTPFISTTRSFPLTVCSPPAGPHVRAVVSSTWLGGHSLVSPHPRVISARSLASGPCRAARGPLRCCCCCRSPAPPSPRARASARVRVRVHPAERRGERVRRVLQHGPQRQVHARASRGGEGGQLRADPQLAGPAPPPNNST